MCVACILPVVSTVVQLTHPTVGPPGEGHNEHFSSLIVAIGRLTRPPGHGARIDRAHEGSLTRFRGSARCYFYAAPIARFAAGLTKMASPQQIRVDHDRASSMAHGAVRPRHGDPGRPVGHRPLRSGGHRHHRSWSRRGDLDRTLSLTLYSQVHPGLCDFVQRTYRCPPSARCATLMPVGPVHVPPRQWRRMCRRNRILFWSADSGMLDMAMRRKSRALQTDSPKR